MLLLTVEDGWLRYDNGFNAAPLTVTRYYGERWEQVGSDLLCGIADVFQDVGIVATGRSDSITSETLSVVSTDGNSRLRPTGDRWVPIDTADKKGKAIYAFTPEQSDWLFVPNCREAVEELMSWIMFRPTGEGFRASAFLGYSTFRQQLESDNWRGQAVALATLVRERCLDKALFYTESGPGTWFVYPGAIELAHLLRLAEPVVARINTELTD